MEKSHEFVSDFRFSFCLIYSIFYILLFLFWLLSSVFCLVTSVFSISFTVVLVLYIIRMMSVWKEVRWNFIGWLGRSVLRFLALTSRISVIGSEGYYRLRAEKKPVVILIWHGRILLASYLFRNKNIMPLISPSQDGEIIVRILSKWRYKILRGSSSHSIFDTWKKMKKELLNRGEVIIVPDGPKGPGRKMKPGGVKLACETNAYLVPFSFSASRRRMLNSWDNFLLFPPFSRVVAFFGEPLECKKDISKEELELMCKKAEDALIDLDNRADHFFAKDKD